MFLSNYKFRNRFKELLCQVHDATQYPRQHPYSALREEAHLTTREFVRANCRKAVPCRSPRQLLDRALDRVVISGNFVEFGVWRGASLVHMANRHPGQPIHGFDSFEGLPEDWLHNARNTFSTGGQMPKVPDNVRLWKGYFEDTLPGWAEQHTQSIAFAHIDCDLRSSTDTVLKYIAPLTQPGTVLLFDDYFNFPGWEEDGHGAFTAVCSERQWKVSYIGYGYKELAVVIG